MNFKKPPVKIGDKISLEITGKDEENHPEDRVAKVDKYVVFIKDCKSEIGEKVDAEITSALPRYGFAKLSDSGE